MTDVGFGLVVYKAEHRFEQADAKQSIIVEEILPGSSADRTQQLEPGDLLVGILGRRVDVLDIDQLRGLMSNLPKDHPISMQFVRDGEKFEVALENDGDELEAYLSEDGEVYYEEDADDDGEQGVQLYAPRDMHALVDKVNSLEHALAIRDDEQVLLERKAEILEQKIVETAKAKQAESTNATLVKLQRKYERVLRRKDRQLEAAKKLSDENQSLRIANAELKALTEMQDKVNQGLQRQLGQSQESFYHHQQNSLLMQAGATASHRSWEEALREQRLLATQAQERLSVVMRERDELLDKLQTAHHQRQLVWNEVEAQRGEVERLGAEVIALQEQLKLSHLAPSGGIPDANGSSPAAASRVAAPQQASVAPQRAPSAAEPYPVLAYFNACGIHQTRGGGGGGGGGGLGASGERGLGGGTQREALNDRHRRLLTMISSGR